jgi:hypothetical protein
MGCKINCMFIKSLNENEPINGQLIGGVLRSTQEITTDYCACASTSRQAVCSSYDGCSRKKHSLQTGPPGLNDCRGACLVSALSDFCIWYRGALHTAMG